MTEQTTSPSPADKITLADYVKTFKDRGFCKIDNGSSNATRLINRFNNSILPLSYIDNDFKGWLHANKKKCEYYSQSYIICTLPHVVGIKFVPNGAPIYREKKTGCNYINTYAIYEPSSAGTEVSPLFLEYLERLVPDPIERHIFIQWLAHIFQKPEERPSWHIMLTSEPGTGKGFLVQSILDPLLKHTSVVPSFQNILGKFSTILEDNLLVLLDDPSQGSDDTQTRLKSMLSEERAYTERKNLQAGMVQTYTRFILASNEARPLRLDANERRWWSPAPLVHKFDKAETQSFIKSLANWLALDGSLCKVFNWFMAYSLDGFNPKHIDQSTNLLSMIDASENIYARFLKEYINEYPVFTVAQINIAFENEGIGKPNPHQLPHLLSELGYKNKKIRLEHGQKNFCIPKNMPISEVKQLCSTHVPAMF